MVERFDDPDQNHGRGQDQGRGRHRCPDPRQGWRFDAHLPTGDELMYRGQADQNQHAATLDAMHRIGMSVGELWLYYLSMGGDIDEYEIDAYLHGLIRLPPLDRDMISQAVNEMIDDICYGTRAPYSSSRDSTTPGISRGTNQEEDGVFADVEGSTRSASQGPVLSVVYSSAATRSFTDADLAELLIMSRSTNHATDLTGLLLYRRGRFLQVLEGPEATVRDRMAIITADPRHTRVRVLVEETRNERHFPDWTMGYEPISPVMSEEVPGYERTFTDEDDDADPANTMRVLRDLIQWFQDRAMPLR
jgi:hypothetical protein